MATPLDSLGIVHETDVLILGAGASGCGAALSASRHGLRVLLADKGKLESCGSLGGGNDHFMAVLNTDAPGDTTETIVDFYCTPTSGYSPSQVRQWVEAMPQMIEVLKSLGIEFLHNADGSFYRTTGFGQPGSWWTHINNGKYIKRRLAGLIRSQGVDVLEYVQCTKILVQDGKAIGAAGFHVLDGTFHIIRAKIVISALGRLNGRVSVNSSLNPFNSAFSPFITGSQIALPYEAGAQIITLDTEQEATLLPKGWGCPGMNGITSSGAKGINALGQRYMGKYHPMMEIGPRYLLIQGTHRELTEGNGPPFVLDLTHIDRDILHHLQYDSMPGDKETWNDYCAQAGIDFSAKPMEVELSELYINGILYLKDNFETRAAATSPGIMRRGPPVRRIRNFPNPTRTNSDARNGASSSLWVSRTASAKTSSKPPSGRSWTTIWATSATRRGCPPPLKSSRSSSPWKTRSWQKTCTSFCARTRPCTFCGRAGSPRWPRGNAGRPGVPSTGARIIPTWIPRSTNCLFWKRMPTAPRLSGPGPRKPDGQPARKRPRAGCGPFPAATGPPKAPAATEPFF